MKHLPILALLFLTPFFSKGTDVIWSKELQDNTKFQYLKILGAAGDGYFVLRSNVSFDDDAPGALFKTRKFMLQCYSKNLEDRWQKEIQANVPESKILDVNIVSGKILVVSYNDKPSGVGYEIYGQFITTSGTFEGNPVKVDELATARFDNDRRPIVIYSKDKTKAALTYRSASADDASQTLHAVVFDTTLQRIYSKDWQLEIPIRRFAPTHFLLTNTDCFYVLGIRYLTDKRVKEPGESYFILYGYEPLKDLFLSHDIRLEGSFLTNVSIAADLMNKQIVVAGFYSQSGMLASAGVFYYGLKQDSLQDGTIYSAPFTDDLLQRAITDRNDFRKKELFNYYVDRLILRKDGGAAIIAESFVETTRSYWDYYLQTMITHSYFRYGNIIVASVNPGGAMLWNRLVQKEQTSTDDGGAESSYCSAVSAGKIFTVFNKYIGRRSSVMIATVDGSGELQTDVLFEESARISVIAKAARQVDEVTLLIPAIKQGEYCIGKVTLH